jgi:hypothetical protein
MVCLGLQFDPPTKKNLVSSEVFIVGNQSILDKYDEKGKLYQAAKPGEQDFETINIFGGAIEDNCNPDFPLQKPLFIKKFITQISAGVDFSLALDSDGVVRSWGDNNHGVLGYSNVSSQKLPTEIVFRVQDQKSPEYKERTEIIYIDCGSNFSMAIDSKKRIWSWGNNTFGQLGYEVGYGICFLVKRKNSSTTILMQQIQSTRLGGLTR